MDIGIRIDENDPVRKLIEICDELDFSALYTAYLRHWRKTDPLTMFELVSFAYMNGILFQPGHRIRLPSRHPLHVDFTA